MDGRAGLNPLLATFSYIWPDLGGRLRGPYCVDCMNRSYYSHLSHFYSNIREECGLPIFLHTTEGDKEYKINDLVYLNGSRKPFLFRQLPNNINLLLRSCANGCHILNAQNAIQTAKQPAPATVSHLPEGIIDIDVQTLEPLLPNQKSGSVNVTQLVPEVPASDSVVPALDPEIPVLHLEIPAPVSVVSAPDSESPAFDPKVAPPAPAVPAFHNSVRSTDLEVPASDCEVQASDSDVPVPDLEVPAFDPEVPSLPSEVPTCYSVVPTATLSAISQASDSSKHVPEKELPSSVSPVTQVMSQPSVQMTTTITHITDFPFFKCHKPEECSDPLPIWVVHAELDYWRRCLVRKNVAMAICGLIASPTFPPARCYYCQKRLITNKAFLRHAISGEHIEMMYACGRVSSYAKDLLLVNSIFRAAQNTLGDAFVSRWRRR